MNEQDIVICIENYLKEGVIPPQPTHPTNTCHPYTGSWTEKLVSAEEYQHIFRKYYTELIIDPGFYNEFSSGLKTLVYKQANRFIHKTGLTFSPFIFLTAKGNN